MTAVEWTLQEREAVGALMCPIHAGRREADCKRCSRLPDALDVLAPFVEAREAQASAGCCACHSPAVAEVDRLTTLLRLRTEALDRMLLQRDEAVAAFKRERARVNRAEALACGPGEGMQPYAVDLDGEVHLAVLLDDLRTALADEGARP